MLKLGLGISLTNRIGAGGGAAPFAFADLYANGEDGLIYDPSQSGLSDGDPVTGATDRINSNDATQATAANQPTYDLTAGVHSFQANGIDEWLRIPNFPIGSDFTAIFSLTDPVQDQTGASILRPLFSAADTSGYGPGSNYYGLEFIKAGGVRFSINGDTVEDTYTPDGSATVLTFRKEGTSAKIYRDGVEIASGTLSTTSGFATGDYALFANASDLGTGRAAKTDLYHAMIIDRALTAQEQADAEALSATFAVDSTDTTAPLFNTYSYDSGTNTITADASEDSTLYYVFSTTNAKPSTAQMQSGLMQNGSAAPLSGNFAVSEAGTTNESVDTSGLADGTYYIFSLLVDTPGNPGTVTDAVTDTKVTPIVNYVNQATNDPAFEFLSTGTTGFDYWFFAASLKATSPEDATAARVYATTGDGSYFFYNGTNKTCNTVMRNAAGGNIYGAVYPLDLTTRKHVAFKYDGLTGTPTLWVDGQVISPSSVGLAATTGSLKGVPGLSIFDRDTDGRSLRAEEVSQLIVATEDHDISDVWDSVNSEPKKVISGLSAELIFGEDMVAADWNSLSNRGTAAADGYTLTKLGGNFVDVV